MRRSPSRGRPTTARVGPARARRSSRTLATARRLTRTTTARGTLTSHRSAAAPSCTRSTVRRVTTKALACSCTTSNHPRRTRSRRCPRAKRWAIDPNTYAEEELEVPTSGGVQHSRLDPRQRRLARAHRRRPLRGLQRASPSKSVITCTGTSTAPVALTGCTVAGSTALTVKPKDDLVQVIATANPEEVTSKNPKKARLHGPCRTEQAHWRRRPRKARLPQRQLVVSPFTTFILNENAPNRVYIDGVAVYCSQSNANPTTKIENCTTADDSR